MTAGSSRERLLRCPCHRPAFPLRAPLVRPRRSVKEAWLSRLILFGKHARRHALQFYEAHYHEKRRHQGKGHVVLMPAVNHSQGYDGSVRGREQLRGLLKYYDREAA
jgi:hypothetical protein